MEKNSFVAEAIFNAKFLMQEKPGLGKPKSLI